MYSSLTIAFAFVQKGIDDSKPVTQMKLQKLVYFAHGIYLAEYSEPLIKDNFKAWEYGPVIPEIYIHYKIYGSSPILETDWLFAYNINSKKEIENVSLNPKAKDVIDTTWEALKDIDAVTLSAWTHKAGSPWNVHYKNGVIPNDEIEAYFKKEFLQQPATSE